MQAEAGPETASAVVISGLREPLEAGEKGLRAGPWGSLQHSWTGLVPLKGQVQDLCT